VQNSVFFNTKCFTLKEGYLYYLRGRFKHIQNDLTIALLYLIIKLSELLLLGRKLKKDRRTCILLDVPLSSNNPDNICISYFFFFITQYNMMISKVELHDYNLIFNLHNLM
jgi:hypothetical protein